MGARRCPEEGLMNEEQCRGILIEMGNAFPKSKPLGTIDEQATLWMRHFRHVDVEDMIDTVMRIVDREQFFPTIKEFARTLSALTDRPLDGAECMCDGTGYYEATKGNWIPCPGCLPETNRRWAEGHFAPGHWCEECAKVTRGEGRKQDTDERRLTARPNGRVLSKEEQQDRLRIVQEVMAEIAQARKNPKHDKLMPPGEKQSFWEERFNSKIRGDNEPLRLPYETFVSPVIHDAAQVIRPHLVLDESDASVDEDGFEPL